MFILNAVALEDVLFVAGGDACTAYYSDTGFATTKIRDTSAWSRPPNVLLRADPSSKRCRLKNWDSLTSTALEKPRAILFAWLAVAVWHIGLASKVDTSLQCGERIS